MGVGVQEPWSEAVAAGGRRPERAGCPGRVLVAARVRGAVGTSHWMRPAGRRAQCRQNQGVLVACGPQVLVPGRPRPLSPTINHVRRP